MTTPTSLGGPARMALTLGMVLGLLGGGAGLMIGLVAYPPTAWFAVLEVGLPAAGLGAVLGLIAGGITDWRPGRNRGGSGSGPHAVSSTRRNDRSAGERSRRSGGDHDGGRPR